VNESTLAAAQCQRTFDRGTLTAGQEESEPELQDGLLSAFLPVRRLYFCLLCTLALFPFSHVCLRSFVPLYFSFNCIRRIKISKTWNDLDSNGSQKQQ
jgi:hypothetical protein